TLDRIDVGLVHLPQELTGVGRQRLHVAALALGVDRVEREARLARPGQPGDHDQAVSRQPNVDVTEVVLSCTRYDNFVRLAHKTSVGAGPAPSGATDRTLRRVSRARRPARPPHRLRPPGRQHRRRGGPSPRGSPARARPCGRLWPPRRRTAWTGGGRTAPSSTPA